MSQDGRAQAAGRKAENVQLRRAGPGPARGPLIWTARAFSKFAILRERTQTALRIPGFGFSSGRSKFPWTRGGYDITVRVVLLFSPGR
jgi:hypothetical protein